MLKRLQFKPGIDRSSTNIAGEGGWWDCDRVRFRDGYPEQIGGWTKLTDSTPSGVIRSMLNWVTLTSENILGLGTNIKYYVEWGTAIYDINPIRYTVTDTDVLDTTNTSTTVTLAATGHGANDGDYIEITGASSVGGIPAGEINTEHQITVVSADAVSFEVTTAATSTATGGGAITADFQISPGGSISTIGTGWGSGTWGRGTWGSSYDASDIVIALRLWTHATFGQVLLYGPRNGPIFIWNPGTGSTPAVTTRGTLLSEEVGASNVPEKASVILVTDDRHVVALGTNDVGSSALDPLLVRWSDQEDYTNWNPVPQTTAGGYRLETGSKIITALKTRQEVLIWTDSALFSMQFVGPPYTFSFHALAKHISIASPQVAATSGDVVYWMGLDKFYIYTGRVEVLHCPVWEYVFRNMNFSQQEQFFAGVNEQYSEIWWFYCSEESNTIDRYVIYNYALRVWYYGGMSRTAWLDSPLRPNPIAAADNQLFYHEDGNSDTSVTPAVGVSSWIQSSDFDIDDGDRFALIQRIIPDVSFGDTTTVGATVTMGISVRDYYGQSITKGESIVITKSSTDTGQYVDPSGITPPIDIYDNQFWLRLRGRNANIKIIGTQAGVRWQLGVPRIDYKPDGRR